MSNLETRIVENYWYPVYADELIQSIHDCDVDWRYQGYIRNDALNINVDIEDETEALEECHNRNKEITDQIAK